MKKLYLVVSLMLGLSASAAFADAPEVKFAVSHPYIYGVHSEPSPENPIPVESWHLPLEVTGLTETQQKCAKLAADQLHSALKSTQLKPNVVRFVFRETNENMFLTAYASNYPAVLLNEKAEMDVFVSIKNGSCLQQINEFAIARAVLDFNNTFSKPFERYETAKAEISKLLQEERGLVKEISTAQESSDVTTQEQPSGKVAR